MAQTITITIPDTIPEILNRTPDEMGRDLRLYGALMLFRLGKLSSGAAAEMAGLPRVMFLDLCAEYGVPVSQITVEDLRREMNVNA
jgi:predicted HTH domain antitoxin